MFDQAYLLKILASRDATFGFLPTTIDLLLIDETDLLENPSEILVGRL